VSHGGELCEQKGGNLNERQGIGGCFDKEFSHYSNLLFDVFLKNKYIPVISSTVLDELNNAPEYIKSHYKRLKNLIILEVDANVLELANLYLKEKIISNNYLSDALHIALATINKIDILVSWNFKHIVNLRKINLFNSVNIKEGYSILEIRSPMEVYYE